MEITTSAYNSNSSYIAFFDLDRTITSAISGRALAREAFRRGLMNRSDLLNAFYLGLTYRLGTGDPVGIMEKMTGWVKGLPEEVLVDLCTSVVEKVMIPSIHLEVISELEMHRSANARTVILSSTLIPVCRAMAGYLRMDDIICSELEVKDNLLTGHAAGKLCYGDEKLRRLREYCEKNNSTPSLSWYYADALIDLPALSIVGFPVCVNPDRKLRKKAMEKEWRIYNWK
jgi:HAD superfamily hydrolase (TIGR01490 family)